MKILIPVVENPVYSRLLFTINSREVYASQLTEEFKKSQGTIQKHLIYLAEQNYLIVKQHPEKKKNIKLFSINWKKIIEEFFNFHMKDGIQGSPNLTEDKWEDELEKLFIGNKRTVSYNLKDFQNKITEEFFVYALSNVLAKEKGNSKYKKIKTLKQLFEGIPIIVTVTINSLEEKYKEQIIERIKENKDFYNFYKIMYQFYRIYYPGVVLDSIRAGMDHLFKDILKIKE